MDIIKIDQSSRICCVSARSFPEQVAEAFHTLHRLLPDTETRTFYGISFGNADGTIHYKAGASEAFYGESEQLELEVFVIQAGTYLSKVLTDWLRNKHLIADTFKEMLKDPRVHPQGYCLEIYTLPSSVQCLVLLNPQSDI